MYKQTQNNIEHCDYYCSKNHWFYFFIFFFRTFSFHVSCIISKMNFQFLNDRFKAQLQHSKTVDDCYQNELQFLKLKFCTCRCCSNNWIPDQPFAAYSSLLESSSFVWSFAAGEKQNWKFWKQRGITKSQLTSNLYFELKSWAKYDKSTQMKVSLAERWTFLMSWCEKIIFSKKWVLIVLLLIRLNSVHFVWIQLYWSVFLY
jgi:hypothetical protein